MSEHIRRIAAMADDDGQSWDLSRNDTEAIRWVIGEIARLTADNARLHAAIREWSEAARVPIGNYAARFAKAREALHKIAEEK